MASPRQPSQPPSPKPSAEEAQEAVPGASAPVGQDPPPSDFVTVNEYTEEEGEQSPSVIPKYPDKESSDDLFRLPSVPEQIALPVHLSPPPPQPEIPVIDLYDPDMNDDFDRMLAEEPNQRRRSHGRRRNRPTGASADVGPQRSGAHSSGYRQPPSRSSTHGSGYRYPPPRHEPWPPSQRRVTVDSRGGATAVRVALPGPASAPPRVPVASQGENDPNYAGTRARKRRAAANYRELNIPPGTPGPSNLRDRPGEADLQPVFNLPPDMVYDPVEKTPYELDLDRQTQRDHMWRPLRADRQTVKVPYYEIRTLVSEAAPTDIRHFNSIDVFLPYFFARLYQYTCVQEGDDPDLPPKHETVRRWQARYQGIMEAWNRTAHPNNPDAGARDIAIETRRRWAAVRTAASITYVLRRASLEPDFRNLLLRLPRLGHTIFTSTTRLLGQDYAAILREVQHRLAQNLRDPVGGMPANLLLGDSHLVPLNWMQGPEGLLPGRVLEFGIHGYSGANTRSIVWLTQVLVSPTTRRVAWLIGTNDAELVPPPTKDDRPDAERRLAPCREGPGGGPRLVTYAQLAMTVVYPPRLIRTLFPTLGGLFVFEIPPRFDYLGNQPIEWRAFRDGLCHAVNIKLWKANRLMQRLLSAEPRINVLALYDRLYEPCFYWRPLGYNQHPNADEQYQAISFAFQWVRDMEPSDDDGDSAN